MPIAKILVPVDFSPSSDAALDYALSIADRDGAEVEVLHVWQPGETTQVAAIFAETAKGLEMQKRLTEAEAERSARVSGRLEFGEEPSEVILSILEQEPFDLVVMGTGQHEEAHVAANVTKTAPCKVVMLDPSGEPKAA